jgi:hypothetical protein
MTNKTSAEPSISKSQFIRDHLHLTPRETIAKAKAQGIILTPAVVYSTRSETKKKVEHKASHSADNMQTAFEDAELRARIIRYGTQEVRRLLDAMDRGE